jgi:hypothetical protein
VSWISASCNRDGKALVANSAKTRENVASPGTSPARCQPHSRRNVLPADSISISSRVVEKLNTAFAAKACAKGRVVEPGQKFFLNMEPVYGRVPLSDIASSLVFQSVSDGFANP